jgi:hypothetical protein
MFEKFIDWILWLSFSVPEVWVPRQSPMFGVARALWAMFLLLGLMYLLSVMFRLVQSGRSASHKTGDKIADDSSVGTGKDHS